MPKQSANSDEPVPLRELCDRYEQDWLLVKMLDWTVPAGDRPCILLARGPTRASMFAAAGKVRKHDQTSCLSVVGGGTKFGDGEALRKALARIAAEDEWVSVNSW